jgi:hypothetical protein
MKKIKIFLLVYLTCSTLCAQPIFELGVQKNFINNEVPFESIKSYSVSLAFLFQMPDFPLYGGFFLNHFVANDQIIKSNKYQQLLPGFKTGLRPIAKFVIFPIQPYFEGYYQIAAFKENPVIKNIYGFGGGVEIYFTKRHALALYYGAENYKFDTNDKLFNNVIRATFRFHSK